MGYLNIFFIHFCFAFEYSIKHFTVYGIRRLLICFKNLENNNSFFSFSKVCAFFQNKLNNMGRFYNDSFYIIFHALRNFVSCEMKEVLYSLSILLRVLFLFFLLSHLKSLIEIHEYQGSKLEVKIYSIIWLNGT